jgi:hypothetical protein
VIRRLAIFLLVLAGALAPALPALEKLVPARVACGCVHCRCNHAACPMPAPVRTENTATNVFVAGFVTRATTPRPARVARVLSTAVAALPAATPGSLPVAGSLTPPSVPLFKAHCSYLI